MTSSESEPEEVAPPERAPRRRIVLGVAAGLLLLLCLLSRPLAAALPGLLIERQAPRAADAIVVLAGDHTGGRVDHAVSLFKAGHLARGEIVMSGGPIYGPRTWAEVMRERAVKAGVPPVRITLQDRSTTTAEDARFTLEALPRSDGAKPVVLLVTSAWHSARAAKHFREEAGDRFEVVSCPAPDPPEEWWRDAVATRALATEVLKRFWFGPGG